MACIRLGQQLSLVSTPGHHVGLNNPTKQRPPLLLQQYTLTTQLYTLTTQLSTYGRYLLRYLIVPACLPAGAHPGC